MRPSSLSPSSPIALLPMIATPPSLARARLRNVTQGAGGGSFLLRQQPQLLYQLSQKIAPQGSSSRNLSQIAESPWSLPRRWQLPRVILRL